MMHFRRTTGTPLSDFVDCLWYFSGGRATRQLALPTGTTELVINLHEGPLRVYADVEDATGQRFHRGVICGPHSKHFVLDSSDNVSVAGVHFRPGGAVPFLGIPLSEVTDQHVSIDDIWGHSAETLRHRLAEAKTPASVLHQLELALISRIVKPPSHHPAVAFALEQFAWDPAVARVENVSRATGYSAKRFIRLFSDGIGITPKRFCRVMRLQAVIRQLARGERVEWAIMAAASGYYDQSHLIREFRTMTGLTPAEYVPIDKNSPNHVAI